MRQLCTWFPLRLLVKPLQAPLKLHHVFDFGLTEMILRKFGASAAAVTDSPNYYFPLMSKHY